MIVSKISSDYDVKRICLSITSNNVFLIYSESTSYEEYSNTKVKSISINPDYIKWLANNIFILETLFISENWINACKIGYTESDKYLKELQYYIKEFKKECDMYND